MAGGRAGADVFDHHQGIEQLDEAAHRVVGFVAVHVDQLAVLTGQFDGAVDGLLAELACPLEVRDAADAVRAHLQRLLDHLVAALVGVHALLREGDDLDGDVVLELFADFQHRLQAGQLRIIHVDVGADELDAFGNLFLGCPSAHVPWRPPASGSS